MASTSGNYTPKTSVSPLVTIEAVIGSGYTITNSEEEVFGLEDLSSSINSTAFIGRQIEITLGSLTLSGIDPENGSIFVTKLLSSDTANLNNGELHTGDIIKIKVF